MATRKKPSKKADQARQEEAPQAAAAESETPSQPAAAADDPTVGSARLPLFYREPQALSSERHGGKSLA